MDGFLKRTTRNRYCSALVIVVSLWTGFMETAKGADGSLEQRLAQQAWERGRWMVLASHILIDIDRTDDPGSIDRALDRARWIESQHENGIDFGVLARTWSDDPSAASNRGNLGYFTVFEQPWAVETAAYLTTPGEVSDPVRSRFGIHLVEVHERLPNLYLKQASHIMLRFGPESRERIVALHQKATPENFADLAATHSDDPRSSKRDGDLGTDRLVDELEAVRLRLDKDEISAPVRSPSGWHILMITEVSPLPGFQQALPSLLAGIKRDQRVEQLLRRSAGRAPTTISGPAAPQASVSGSADTDLPDSVEK